MSASFKLTDAAAYQSYVQHFASQLISKLYLGFETAKIARKHEGLRGKKVLTEMLLGNMIQSWGKGFNPTPDAIDFQPRVLETHLVKVDLQIYPQELVDTYMGELRDKGASPTDIPFPQFLLGNLIAKWDEEKEINAWAGKRLPGVVAGDPLNDTVTGYQEIVKAEIAAGNLTPVVTGAIDDTNAIAKARLVYEALDPVYQMTALTAYVSPGHMLKLQKNYQDLYGKYTGQDGKAFKFGIGVGNGGVTFKAFAGIQGDFMMITPEANLHYGYAQEGEIMRFDSGLRNLDIATDFHIGYQIAVISDKLLRTNDQGIS